MMSLALLLLNSSLSTRQIASTILTQRPLTTPVLSAYTYISFKQRPVLPRAA